MAFDPTIAVFDACIPYPFHLRNIVVQAAVDRLVDARWTDDIHDEWTRTLAAKAPALPAQRLRVTRRLMNDVLPEATVSGYRDLVHSISLPDLNDRHVVAAGIAAGASVILTWNIRHFPVSELRKFGLRAETPDSFLVELHEKVPALTIGSLANARRNLSRSGLSASDFIEVLKAQRLVRLAKRLQRHVADL